MCLDIEKCDTNDRKYDVNADCFNDVGSHSCLCHGWDTTDGGETGFDVDECTFTCDDAVCDNSTCNNIDGSFECTCLVDYSGTACTDNNEYQDSTINSDENASCFNTNGSFTCIYNPSF